MEHSRLQSRSQSGIKHRKKGWHAFQEPGSVQTAPTSSSNNSPAVYMRPDRTVQADMSTASFPSLSPAPADASKSAASQPKQACWQTTSPNGRLESRPAVPLHSPPQSHQQQKAQYAAAVSPQLVQQAKHAGSKHDGMALSDTELAAITQLLSLHQWAEPGLVRAVLAAVDHQLHAADLLLRDMEQHQAPSGTDSDEDFAHIQDSDHMLPQAGAASAQTHEARVSKAPAPPIPESRADSSREGQQEEEPDTQDVYFKYRREALKLSRTWRKKLHRAANAFAAGQYSEGKRLATDAHHIRLTAQAAHAEAAQRIEQANNAGRGLDQAEIDLHGLHAVEAVAALDKRLSALSQLHHHSQATKLRVIVGRGNNSSGGEASLPRVIESHLLSRNMNYITGLGVITVYLRGQRH